MNDLKLGSVAIAAMPEIKMKLAHALLGSCNCLTKTPVIEHHTERCRYRLLSEIESLLDEPTDSTGNQIRSMLAAMPNTAGAGEPLLVWPAGYCLDPNGKMSIPEGQDEAWSFGYEIGFREAMGIKLRAV